MPDQSWKPGKPICMWWRCSVLDCTSEHTGDVGDDPSVLPPGWGRRWGFGGWRFVCPQHNTSKRSDRA